MAASFLKLELLPQPTFHKRKAELAFLEDFFARVVGLVRGVGRPRGGGPGGSWRGAVVGGGRHPRGGGKPLHKVRGLKVCFLPNA